MHKEEGNALVDLVILTINSAAYYVLHYISNASYFCKHYIERLVVSIKVHYIRFYYYQS